MIGTIDIDELMKMCMSDSTLIRLLDKLKITRLRVKYGLIDDLDFFTFPKKYVNHKKFTDNMDLFDEEYERTEKKALYKKFQ